MRRCSSVHRIRAERRIDIAALQRTNEAIRKRKLESKK